MTIHSMEKGLVLGAGFLLSACGLSSGQDTLRAKEMPLPVGVGSADTSSSKVAFERIAKAWLEGDAEGFAPFLGEGKVTIQLPRVVGGVLSRNQAEYVLKDLFKYTTTDKFEFKKYDAFLSEGVAGIADRTYRSGKDGPAQKDRVSVWLVQEGREKPQWVIREIRVK
jgi:hypothetical protein